MSYNSAVIIRGVRQPIMLSKNNAEQVKSVFENNSVDESYVISIGNQSFRKGEIKHIEILSDGHSQQDEIAFAMKQAEEENTKRQAILKKPLEERAKDLLLFRMFYRYATGQKATTDVLEVAYGIQYDFFKRNPQRTICDPRLWKDIIGNKVGSVSNYYEQAFFRLIVLAVDRDLKLSGHKYPSEN